MNDYVMIVELARGRHADLLQDAAEARRALRAQRQHNLLGLLKTLLLVLT